MLTANDYVYTVNETTVLNQKCYIVRKYIDLEKECGVKRFVYRFAMHYNFERACYLAEVPFKQMEELKTQIQNDTTNGDEIRNQLETGHNTPKAPKYQRRTNKITQGIQAAIYKFLAVYARLFA